MKYLKNRQKLQEYIDLYQLQSYMDTPLAEIGQLVTFEKSEHLIELDQSSNHLYFLLEGNVMIYTPTLEDQKVCISYTHPIALLGEASSLWKKSPKSNVLANTACLCLCIPLNEHRTVLQNDLLFLQTICLTLSDRLNSGALLASSLIEPVDVRLAKYILAHQKNSYFNCKLTTCATTLNVSYRHLTRLITQFKKEGIIQKEQQEYLILNPEKLTDIAKMKR